MNQMNQMNQMTQMTQMINNIFALLRQTISLMEYILDSNSEENQSVLPYCQYKSIIKKYKYQRKKHGEITCSICLEQLCTGKIVHKTPCGHTFHPMCLRNAICKFGPVKCPLCRHSLLE